MKAAKRPSNLPSGNPALREMVAVAQAKHPIAHAVAAVQDLEVPHFVAALAELGLRKATKKELLFAMKTAMAREAAGL